MKKARSKGLAAIRRDSGAGVGPEPIDKADDKNTRTGESLRPDGDRPDGSTPSTGNPRHE